MNTGVQMDTELKEQIGKAIGRIASGVYVVTLDHDGHADGLMASWLSQAAFEPPCLTLAVKSDRPILSGLQPGKKFTVNVLAKSNMDIFKNFAKPFTPGLNRFEGLNHEVDSEYGYILSDSIAYMKCRSLSSTVAGDHTIIAAEIVAGGMLNAELEPMVHLRRNGFQY